MPEDDSAPATETPDDDDGDTSVDDEDPPPIGVEEEPDPEDNDGDDFKRVNTGTAKTTHGVKKSKLKPTKTEALLKFIVVDKGNNDKPIEGIVVSLTGPDEKKYYTQATDATGYAELLVPAGHKYQVVYVSLKGKDVGANLTVEDKARFTLKLTLRYAGWVPPEKAPRLVLDGVEFDTGKAKIRPGSFSRLDNIVEYMTYKPNARIEISGHTDNVGKKEANKSLSQKRAEACREYLISKGIDGSRIKAVGYGDERPIASNSSPAGRQKNRRIEAEEL